MVSGYSTLRRGVIFGPFALILGPSTIYILWGSLLAFGAFPTHAGHVLLKF